MAYSRWGDSVWYVYWGSCGFENTDQDTLEKQVLVIQGVSNFTYLELKTKFDICMGKIRNRTQYEKEELYEEVEKYLREFLWDMENEYAPDSEEETSEESSWDGTEF